MKKFITTFIIFLISIWTCCGKKYDFTELDSIVITFLSTPNSKIDTVLFVNNKKVTVRGIYQFNPLYIYLTINSWSNKILGHCDEVFSKGIGLTSYSDFYYTNKGLVLSIDNPNKLYCSLKEGYQREVNRVAREREERERIAREEREERERLEREERERIAREKEERERIAIHRLDSLKSEYLSKNNSIEEMCAQKLADALNFEYTKENYIENLKKRRLEELDVLEKKYIHRLDGEVFLTKKAELNEKYEALIKNAESQIRGKWNGYYRWKKEINDDFWDYLVKNGYRKMPPNNNIYYKPLDVYIIANVCII